MLVQQNLVELWLNEYVQRGIPSSFKEEPSGPLIEFIPLLKKGTNLNSLALDLGCGRGRNSIFLAKQGFDVYSVDFVPELIEELRYQSEMLGLCNRVHTYTRSLTEPWIFASQMFDVVVDTFCYKHQVEDVGKELYRQELARVMKPGGLYLLTLASINDGYYGSLLASSPQPDKHLIIDPATGIGSILYTKEAIESEFTNSFSLVHYECQKKNGLMHGKNYDRRTLVFIFSRR